jgi:GNAT superfamily N-acetyltransferase
MSAVEPITVERATILHVDGILDCLRAAFAPYQSAYTADAYKDTVLTRESLLRRLEEMIVLVALDRAGHVLGTLAYNVTGREEGHLRGMAVRPERQGRGIADQLLECAETELIEQHCSRISLDTTEPLERAMAFYARHGFRPSGKTQDFFGMPLMEYVKIIEREG